MAKYLSELIFITFSSNKKVSTKYKLLLPYKYAKIFCNLISGEGKKKFSDYFEDDIEFQEIIFEFYGDIDEDIFEEEVEYLKESGTPEIFMEILDFFLDDGVKTSENYNGKLNNSTVLLLKDLTGNKPDYTVKIKM